MYLSLLCGSSVSLLSKCTSALTCECPADLLRHVHVITMGTHLLPQWDRGMYDETVTPFRYCLAHRLLARTHELEWGAPWTWERWVRKDAWATRQPEAGGEGEGEGVGGAAFTQSTDPRERPREMQQVPWGWNGAGGCLNACAECARHAFV